MINTLNLLLCKSYLQSTKRSIQVDVDLEIPDVKLDGWHNSCLKLCMKCLTIGKTCLPIYYRYYYIARTCNVGARPWLCNHVSIIGMCIALVHYVRNSNQDALEFGAAWCKHFQLYCNSIPYLNIPCYHNHGLFVQKPTTCS